MRPLLAKQLGKPMPSRRTDWVGFGKLQRPSHCSLHFSFESQLPFRPSRRTCLAEILGINLAAFHLPHV